VLVGTKHLGGQHIQRAVMEKMSRDLRQSAPKMRKAWRDLEARSDFQSQQVFGLQASFPQGGFWHRTVQRLLITFGTPKHDRTVWMALKIKREKN
jgi:hypothetical protein